MFEKLNNLKIWQKLMLVTGLLALPIVALLVMFVQTRNQQVAHTREEIDGVEYIAILRPVLEHITQHRDTALAVLYGDESMRDRLDAIRKKLDVDFTGVEAVDERLGKSLRVSSNWQSFKAAWRQLQPQATALSARDSFTRHTALVNQTLELIRMAGEASGLRTDQDLGTFHLADTMISQAPLITEHLSQLRSFGAGLASRGKANPEESAQTLYLMTLIGNLNEAVQRNMAGALKTQSLDVQVKSSNGAKATLTERAKNATAATDAFRKTAERELIAKADAITLDSHAFADLGTVAVEEYFALLDDSLDRMRTQLSRRVGDLNDEKYGQLILAFGVLALTAFIAFSVNLGITRQLRSILKTFDSISVGDYEARADVYYKDELGQTAAKLNSTLDNTVVLIQSRSERDSIQNSIMKLLDEVSGVAEGDLRKEAEVTSDITGAIADSFNYMIGELRGLISSVQTTSLAVDLSARQMQSSAQSLAEGSGHQSTQIAEASRTIEQINESIRLVATAASSAATVAETAQASARSGSLSVQKTIDGMDAIRVQVQETGKRVKRLGESSQEIGEIVQLIGDIADRTSILALNASIQAAAAGDAGRGFAVVAEEVERLAVRAAESTKRIGHLIRSVQTDTNEAVAAVERTTKEVVGGSQLANDAGLKLSEIETVSHDISRLVKEILEATRRQAESSESVTRKVSGVTEFTSNTAHSARQVEGSVRQLASLAQALNESMSRFKLPETEEQSVAV